MALTLKQKQNLQRFAQPLVVKPDLSAGYTDPTVRAVGQTTTSTGGTTTTTTHSLPSTTTGDLNILVLSVCCATNLTDPGVPTIAGATISQTPGGLSSDGKWTTLGTSYADGSPGNRLTVVARIFQAGDSSTVAWAWTNASNHALGGVAFQTGTFDAGIPMEHAQIRNQSVSGQAFPMPVCTPSRRGAVVEIASCRTSGTWTMPDAKITEAYSASSANFALALRSVADPDGPVVPTAQFSAGTGLGSTVTFSVRGAPIAPTFVAVGTPQALTTTATVPYPAGVAPGDTLVLYEASADGTLTSNLAASGWRLLSSRPSGGGVNDSRVWIKRAPGGESGTIGVTATGGTKGVAMIAAYRPPSGQQIVAWAEDVGALDLDTGSTNFWPLGSMVDLQQGDRLLTFGLAAAATTSFTASFSGVTLGGSGTATLGQNTARTAARIGTNTLNYCLIDKPVTAAGQWLPQITNTTVGDNSSGSAIFVVLRAVEPRNLIRFDRGTPGAMVSTSDTWDAPSAVTSLGVNGSVLYDGEKVLHGKGSLRLVHTGSGADYYAQYAITPTNRLGVSFSFRYEQTPTSSTRIVTVATGTPTGYLSFNLAGNVFLQNNAGTTLWTAPSGLTPGNWYRVEMFHDNTGGTGFGTFHLAIYDGDSPHPLSGFTYDAYNTATGTGQMTQILVGHFTGSGLLGTDVYVGGLTWTTGDKAEAIGADTGVRQPTFADTATATDAISVVVSLTVDDPATATDAISVTGSGPTPIGPIDDPATATDAITVAATTTVADTAAATDAVSATAATTIADTAAGSDAVAVAITLPVLTDTAAGADAVTIAATPPSQADTAAGSDAVSVAAALTVADTATATDSISVVVTVLVADTATATDAMPVTGHAMPGDTATATDAITVAATPPVLTDTASGTDAVTVSAATTIADTATATDGITVQQNGNNVSVADTATATDAISVAVTLSVADTATATDAPGVSAAVTVADTAAATDATTVSTTVSVSDTATATDAMPVTGHAMPGDTATATDAISVAATLSQADTAAGSDAISVATTVTVADTATGTDGVTVQNNGQTVNVADTATATDAITVVVTLSVADTAAGTDAVTIAATLSVADTAAAVDAIAHNVAFTIADTATGTDAVTALAISTTIADTATATDSLSAAVTALVADAAAAVDALGVAATIGLADTATATDTVGHNVALTLADTATATDTLTLAASMTIADIATVVDAITTFIIGSTPITGSSSHARGGTGRSRARGGAGRSNATGTGQVHATGGAGVSDAS